MKLTTTEVLERIAEGDMQTVIRSVSDPLERWELERRVQAIHVADEDCQDTEQVAELVDYAKDAIYAAISAVDEELSDAIADAMDTKDEKARSQEIREALDGYVARRTETILANLRGKERAAAKVAAKFKQPVEVPADITEDAPAIDIAAAIAEREAVIRSTGPTTLVLQR